MNEHLRQEYSLLTKRELGEKKVRKTTKPVKKALSLTVKGIGVVGKTVIDGLNYLSKEGQKSKPKRAVPSMRVDLSSGRNKAQRKFVSEVNDTLKQARIARAKRKIEANRRQQNRHR